MTNQTLERLQSVAHLVGARLATHPDVAVVLVMGSVALGHVDDRSDVDLFVVCRSRIVPTADRRRLLSSIGSAWTFHDRSNGNRLFANADVDGHVGDVLVTVHYQTVVWIRTVLHAVLDQGAITTKQLPFRPYTLPGLLLRGLVLSDSDGLVASWRDQAKPYPELLKRNIVQHYVPLLRENLEDLVNNAERGLGPRTFIFRISRVVDALISILYALNDTYDPADRRAERVIWPTLTNVPADFIARLTDVQQGPFDDAGARHRARRISELANDVLQMVNDYSLERFEQTSTLDLPRASSKGSG
jgi:predicted nucleotidyltransferase